jgi:hypothetical protein
MNLFLVSGGPGHGVNDLRGGLLSAFRRWGIVHYLVRVSETLRSLVHCDLHWDGCMMTRTLVRAFGENLIPCCIVTSKNYMLPGSNLLQVEDGTL